jgi:sugar/nucleoside kinase (ribokinase family)
MLMLLLMMMMVTNMNMVSMTLTMDVCGAGDTFLASLVYNYLNTHNINEAIRFANRSAAITVQHMGVYSPKLEELQ